MSTSTRRSSGSPSASSTSPDTPSRTSPPSWRGTSSSAPARGSIAFTQAARARAILAGRDHVVPEDIKALAHRVLRHRVVLGFEAIADDTRVETVVDALVATVRTP